MFDRILKENTGHWTDEEDEKLRRMLHSHSHSLKEIAFLLGRTEKAIRLYIHRERIALNPVIGKNLLLELLRIRFLYPELFMPNRKFYNDVKINQNRWWRLYRGEENPTEEEYSRLIEYFKVENEVVFKKRQLEIEFI
ncbi:MAG: SANT/Myb domain-containing protein [Candidatus Symbiothrix sp.]|jgi:hypothetical protein|nr:SANT/Myb domain-containing protein [Candidatus Symbiothrix sp.]